MMLSSGGTTKRLDRLETAGYIERIRDPDDRRGTLIRLTTEGLETIHRSLQAITLAENAIVVTAIESAADQTTVADGLRDMLLAQEAIGIDVRLDD
jgi:DNA-binding MarR family transcriptional regulator